MIVCEDPDPVNKDELIHWLYPPSGSPPRPQGAYCFYCGKAFKPFKIAYGTMRALVDKMGTDKDVHDKVMSIRRWPDQNIVSKHIPDLYGKIVWANLPQHTPSNLLC